MELKLHETLKKILEERHISLNKLSRETKIPLSTISDWLNQKVQSPNVIQVRAISEYLKADMHELLFGAKDHNSAPDIGSALSNAIKMNVFGGVFEVNIRKIDTEKK